MAGSVDETTNARGGLVSSYLKKEGSINRLSSVGAVDSSRAPMQALNGLPGNRCEPYVGLPRRKTPLLVSLFLVSLVLPWIISVGPINLFVYRIVLLIIVIPCFVGWLRGRAGPIRAEDGCILMYCLWGIAGLVNAHGLGGSLEPAGIFFVETMGAYLLARCYIRDAGSFGAMTQLVVTLVILLLPFAIYEWKTGSKPLLSVFGEIFPTVESAPMEPRLGFWRAQGPFSHSILFGAICSSTLTLAFLVAGKTPLSRFLLAGTVFFTAATSMSSAPMANLALQIFLLSWNGVFKAYAVRWKFLIGISLLSFLCLQFGSNQGAIRFYISHFTFDKETAWFRILIWDFGSASVLNHPLFGIGLGNWVRPAWMPDSVDNFWLLTAMRYGLPALGFLVAACTLLVARVARKSTDERLERYRTGYLICLITYFIVGTTVHFWAASYVWFCFLLGSGAWFPDLMRSKPHAIGRSVQTPASRRSARLYCLSNEPSIEMRNLHSATEKRNRSQKGKIMT